MYFNSSVKRTFEHSISFLRIVSCWEFQFGYGLKCTTDDALKITV